MPVKGVDSDALETLVYAFYTAECPLELARVPALYDAAIKLEVRRSHGVKCAGWQSFEAPPDRFDPRPLQRVFTVSSQPPQHLCTKHIF